MKYFQKITILLGLIWGFIAIQRIVIAIIMPAIQADMKFSYTDVGLIISITGFVWAFGVVIWANIGDRYGRRPVIAGCAILASVFSFLTGVVQNLGQMLAVRGILGFFEGGPWGPAVSTVGEESPEKGGKTESLPICQQLGITQSSALNPGGMVRAGAALRLKRRPPEAPTWGKEGNIPCSCGILWRLSRE